MYLNSSSMSPSSLVIFLSKREHSRLKPLNQPLVSIVTGSTESATELRESFNNLVKHDIMHECPYQKSS